MSSNTSISNKRRLLDPSELGTKEYWDTAYAQELHNHTADATDEGTVWFSENGAEEAILAQLDSLAHQGLLHRDAAAAATASTFLDLGTGNGHLLFTLRNPPSDEDDEDDDNDHEDHHSGTQGWTGPMVGIDYSPASIALARRIAAQKGLDDVRFEEWDLLSSRCPEEWFVPGGFDVVLDKGTFDAISLMPPPEHGRANEEGAGSGIGSHPCEVYRARVEGLVKTGGFWVVTSCNWTKEELLEWLAPEERRGEGGEGEGGGFEMFAEARYPSFTFGGQTGQTIVTLVLRRKGKDARKG